MYITVKIKHFAYVTNISRTEYLIVCIESLIHGERWQDIPKSVVQEIIHDKFEYEKLIEEQSTWHHVHQGRYLCAHLSMGQVHQFL